MKIVKKVAVTVAGVVVIFVGLLLIVLPGPALIIIPFGLAILATEYDFAHRWVKLFQKKLSSTASYLDKKLGM